MRLLRLLLEKPRAYLVVPFFLRLSISTSRSTKFHFFLRRQKKFLLFFTLYIIMATLHAGVMELVDVVDSKSTASDGVPVRVRPPAPKIHKHLWELVDFYLLLGVTRRVDDGYFLSRWKAKIQLQSMRHHPE